MDAEVEEQTGQGVQRNGSYSITSGKHQAVWEKISTKDSFYCTLFPWPMRCDWFITTTSGQIKKQTNNCMKIGRHKHPYYLEFFFFFGGEERLGIKKERDTFGSALCQVILPLLKKKCIK